MDSCTAAPAVPPNPELRLYAALISAARSCAGDERVLQGALFTPAELPAAQPTPAGRFRGTPGPWRAEDRGRCVVKVAPGLPFLIAEIFSGSAGIDAADANGAIIAAAP